MLNFLFIKHGGNRLTSCLLTQLFLFCFLYPVMFSLALFRLKTGDPRVSSYKKSIEVTVRCQVGFGAAEPHLAPHCHLNR